MKKLNHFIWKLRIIKDTRGQALHPTLSALIALRRGFAVHIATSPSTRAVKSRALKLRQGPCLCPMLPPWAPGRGWWPRGLPLQ